MATIKEQEPQEEKVDAFLKQYAIVHMLQGLDNDEVRHIYELDVKIKRIRETIQTLAEDLADAQIERENTLFFYMHKERLIPSCINF